MNDPRLPYFKLVPGPLQSLLKGTNALNAGKVGSRLVDLVSLRVAQINGCMYCSDLHWRQLTAGGEDPRLLNAVATWREAPFFDMREKAALDWAERLTRGLPETVGDRAFADMLEVFDEVELTELTVAVALANAWNRLGVTFQTPIPTPEERATA